MNKDLFWVAKEKNIISKKSFSFSSKYFYTHLFGLDTWSVSINVRILSKMTIKYYKLNFVFKNIIFFFFNFLNIWLIELVYRNCGWRWSMELVAQDDHQSYSSPEFSYEVVVRVGRAKVVVKVGMEAVIVGVVKSGCWSNALIDYLLTFTTIWQKPELNVYHSFLSEKKSENEAVIDIIVKFEDLN